jgi:hypothetical protein
MFLLDMRPAPKTGLVGDWFGANIPEYFMAAMVEAITRLTGQTATALLR